MYFAFYYTIVTRTRIKIDNVSRTLYFIEKWCTVEHIYQLFSLTRIKLTREKRLLRTLILIIILIKSLMIIIEGINNDK